MKQRSIFDEGDRLERLAELVDQLLKLDNVIDWRVFRPVLKRVFESEAKGAGGRPPFDRVMMFKILVLQQLYGISDAQAEYQINDRLSFQRSCLTIVRTACFTGTARTWASLCRTALRYGFVRRGAVGIP